MQTNPALRILVVLNLVMLIAQPDCQLMASRLSFTVDMVDSCLGELIKIQVADDTAQLPQLYTTLFVGFGQISHSLITDLFNHLLVFVREWNTNP